MRREPTEAEHALWRMVRNRRFAEYKFRRQVPLGPYIADFVCLERKLIIEADGSQHAENTRDAARDRWLAMQGYRVLRFWNADILRRQREVSDTLWHHLAYRFSAEADPLPDPSSGLRPPSPAGGEGENSPRFNN